MPTLRWLEVRCYWVKKVGLKAALYVLRDFTPAVGISVGFALFYGTGPTLRITGMILMAIGFVALAFMVREAMKYD